jgi:hypothetical protein
MHRDNLTLPWEECLKKNGISNAAFVKWCGKNFVRRTGKDKQCAA